MTTGLIAGVREKNPLVHCITNYVTVNDVANGLLAIGASPVMADAAEEAAVFGGVCDCLYINIGTLNNTKVPAMRLAGEAAAAAGRPIVLDPVGVGATPYRMETAQMLLECLPVTLLRGNASEIKALARAGAGARGVDAAAADIVTEADIAGAADFACALSERLGVVVSFSGAIDIIADASTAYAVRNGVDMMPLVTGSGCVLSALAAAFLGAHAHAPLQATVAAYAVMGLCGELAHANLRPDEGTGSFRARMLDALYHMDDSALQAGMKVAQVR